jgi:hypothetical protein
MQLETLLVQQSELLWDSLWVRQSVLQLETLLVQQSATEWVTAWVTALARQ